MIQIPQASARPGPRLRGCRAVFLDRDGTINVKAPAGQYVTSPTGLSLLPGAAAAISRLNAAGLRVILATNQRWLSGPARDLVGYGQVHGRLEELLAAEGAHLDAAYCCPHATGTCTCRKPGPGLLQRAAEQHRIELSSAVMIGDSETDVAAGRAAGTTTILLRAGQWVTSADFIVNGLAEAVHLILGEADISPQLYTPAADAFTTCGGSGEHG